MPKPTKSSASSGTRKKHARKAGKAEEGQAPPPKDKRLKGKEKAKAKSEPKKKVYIPPSRPVPVQVDPLDSLGLAKILPPEFVVVLRRLSKKDAVTKGKALDELLNTWVGKVNEQPQISSALEQATPVWVHHLPALLLHPSKRIRLLSASLHTALIRLPPLRKAILYHLREISTQDQSESVLGAWSMASRDVDRQVASYARRSWTDCIRIPTPISPDVGVETESAEESTNTKLTLEGETLSGLLSFVQRAVMDPAGLYLYLNPVQVAVAPTVHHGSSRATRGKVSLPPRREELEGHAAKIVDPEEESDTDRRARLRIGGLGVLQYLIETRIFFEHIAPILTSAELWSSLHYGSSCPYADLTDGGCFGYEQPVVRTAAWTTLASLLSLGQGSMDSELVELLSIAILRSAFVEPDQLVRAAMWKPLLLFLKEHPTAWEIEMKHATGHYNTQEEDDHDQGEGVEGSEDEDGDIVAAHYQSTPHTESTNPHSVAYAEFLQFLELGCSGSPTQGYPTIVIILSTIPSSILLASTDIDSPSSTSYPASNLFTSFWAAIDGRALSSLDRSTTSAAFLSSLLECLTFVVRRLRSKSLPLSQAEPSSDGNEPGGGPEVKMVADQYRRTWEEFSETRLKVDERMYGKIVAEGFKGLEKIDATLFEAAWTAFTQPMEQSTLSSRRLVTITAKTLSQSFEVGSEAQGSADNMVKEVAIKAATRCNAVLDGTAGDLGEDEKRDGIEGLRDVLQVFEGVTWEDGSFAELVDSTVNRHSAHLLLVSPSLLMTYLASRSQSDSSRALSLWRSMLISLSSAPSMVYGALPTLLDAVEKGSSQAGDAKAEGWVFVMSPEEREFDDVLMALFADATNSDQVRSKEAVVLLERVIQCSKRFITPSSFETLFQLLVGSFTHQSTALLVLSHISDATTVSSEDSEPESPSTTSPSSTVTRLEMLLRLIAAALKVRPDLGHKNPSLFVESFLVAYLLPRCVNRLPGSRAESLARNIWVAWATVKGGEGEVLEALKLTLTDALGNVNVRASPSDILRAASENTLGITSSFLNGVIPTSAQLDAKLSGLRSTPTHPSLAITQPLVPPPSSFPSTLTQSTDISFDSYGFSSYARLVSALLYTFTSDLHLAKGNVWALKHFIALASFAEEYLHLPHMESDVFRVGIDKGILEGLIERAKMMEAYLLVLPVDVVGQSWHAKVVKSVLPVTEGKVNGGSKMDGVEELIVSLVEDAKREDTYRTSRILAEVLKHILVDASRDETEQWMTLARKLERLAPQSSLAILHVIARQGSEPALLTRYRNELAAGILGIKPENANTEGLILLRRLAASAPDPESEVVFLPQPRAVNFMKTCQKWITGSDDDDDDEGIDEDVQSEMTGVFLDMAPILQNVPGGHWELIFDIIENNLENASFNDDASLVVLWRTVKLIQMIQDFAIYNKSLRADWQERQSSILGLLRGIVTAQPDSISSSIPRSICRERALAIVAGLPSSSLDENTFAKMLHLVVDPSPNIQKMAYDLLHEAARKRTEWLVIEVGVDAESTIKPELPSELVGLLQTSLELDIEDHISSSEIFACLLGWMLTFDLFTDTSMKVRSGYTEQLRNLNLVDSGFIPLVLDILNLRNGMAKAFKLDIWSVEEFYLSSYDTEDFLSLRLLAAHLYYRALLTIPSLIRSWLLDCKDRNLFTTVSNYTSQHFSPVIINAELAQLKSSRASAELDDENLAVKVATSVNEVTAVYTVDEQQLQITLKVPSDWPLHGIDVKDSQRVGVTESKWRGWLLGVQQIVWTQNGHIVDALSLFKKNVSLHFEGQGECAICYSIISVVDSALPTKPCKTCKNRFHSSCLYKWFNTSHSSSCPLCRSDIM